VTDRNVNFIYKLNGDVTEIDVFQLAPTLLALGELIQESNRQINPSGRDIGVNVKPFREGSFIVDLTVFANSNLQQFIDLMAPHTLEEVKTLLEIIGLTATGLVTAGYGAVKVIRFLGGKPKSVEEIAPGEFRYTSIEDKSITVKAPVHQLLSNSRIVTNIYKIYAVPMQELPFVTDITTFLEGDEASEVIVSREDVPAIKEYVSPSAVPGDLEESIKETTIPDVYLNPKRGAFDGDPRDWSFRRGDDIITATIKDRDFLHRCTKGEYRLNHNDLLVVDLLERQRIVGTKVLKPVHEIIKVKEYIMGEQQQKLDF
jgi:hypothetical protein